MTREATLARHADAAPANRALLRKLVVVVVAMFGFGFLLVPFYQKICEVTGLQALARPDTVGNTQVDTTREVRIDFDTNLRNLAWTFKPVTPDVSVHPGAVTQVEFEVVNRTDRPVTGQAIPSYAPAYAAQYFRKLECFCFTKQTLQPGETRRMPVVFVLDPSAPRELNVLTLSYTFFPVEGNG
ncbi:MAG TPA: cytochrome c oxidase assembly protein [Casimicrobiaceae bacterium]|nr:cytochrome c oxidase assembly protein [Casimicrobiaceae bacterium]